VCKLIGGGALGLECVQIVFPACGQQVEGVAWGGHLKDTVQAKA